MAEKQTPQDQTQGAGEPGWQPVPGVRLRMTLCGHKAEVFRIAWSPDGRRLASPSRDKTIRIWDAVTGEVVRTLEGHTGNVWSVAWSPDGRRLASAANDQTVRRWDAETGKALRTLEGHTGNVWSVAWSPDGRRLASASSDKTVRLWDAETGQALRTLEGHANQVNSVAWSPDGLRLASAAMDNTVRLWDAETGQALRTFEGHSGTVWSVAWSPEAGVPRLASVSNDKTVRIWNAETGQATNVLEGHTSASQCAAVSPDAALIASKGGASDNTVRLWRCDTWQPVAVIPEPASIYWPPSVAFHPHEPLLATVGSDRGTEKKDADRLIHIWELDYAVLLGRGVSFQLADKELGRQAGSLPHEGVLHATAKIVLVGDSGVGKTGLGWRLAHGTFKEHASTHGQQFWVLDQLQAQRTDGTRCEAVLWDLAGQPDYRLIHALHVADADLALILFDPTHAAGDVLATEGETEITIEDPGLFRIGMDGGRKFPDDICLCALNAKGQPDWSRSEQVKLVSMDAGQRVIRVRRGLYGTRPMALSAGKSWVAAHATEPWGYEDGASWIANYSPFCPQDARGRTAADILLEEFSALFVRGGSLAHYDGLEFDVMPFAAGSRALERKGRDVDTDGDGLADGGYREGVNVYGIGFYRFAEALRKRLGPDKLFMADGNTHTATGAQRCFGVLNGIESEWWPRWGDMDVTLWSYGLNLHRFWNQNAHPAAFSYFIHKIGGHDRKKFLAVPWRHHRLVMAASQLVDAAFTSFYTTKPEPGETIGVWDEMVEGKARRTGWLGQPLSPPVHLARCAPDLLEGTGVTWSADLVGRFKAPEAMFAVEETQLRVSAKSDTRSLAFRLEGIPCRQGQDLLVTVKLKAQSRPAYPAAMPRLLTVGTDVQGQPTLESFVGKDWFDATFYFRNLPSNRLTLRFTLEGSEPFWLSDLKVHAHPDAAYRLFEKGLVLANPGDQPFTFQVAPLEPARRYRRICGTALQDPRTNDGSLVGETVTLAGRDGLFLAVETEK